nr:ABC transporter substrate-binding protein [Burkholderiales bacterium]
MSLPKSFASGCRLRGFSRLIFCLLLSGLLSAAYAQSPGAERGANSTLYLYQDEGAKRERRLVEKAKEEGGVLIYTSMNTKDSIPLTEAFEKKYGIKVTLWHSVGEKIVLRALTEARAGRHDVDIIGTNGDQMEILYREKLLAPFYSPSLQDLPVAALAPHKHYVAARINFFVLAYNTKLVTPKDVPGSYDDLLN